ncbi:DUF2254 domain-containing protein [Sagittula salina]|uniref:DUF2254 domain-containing protein n=1 Tax=Sagittula salina TaxID=2820268 RepID=A0A940S1G7_9RHOB|nr:DUF2254 domain-containing protein [Sagittula salina]MBP0483047.1 DUF2254 domain-containing protein [Sagittula salina]
MDRLFSLPRKALRILQGLSRRLWVRVALFGLLAIAVIPVSQLVERLLPEEVQGMVAGASVDRLLDIIATAMLTVTTFSLTVMVSTNHATASQFTPRLQQLIRQDPITQNTLATFIGSYVYALAAIVLREVSYIGDEKALVMFVVTVTVLVLIVWSLIRWMIHLQTLGSLINSARQVEEITDRQFRERLKTPCLGAVPLTGDVPEDGVEVRAPETGYVQMIHPEPIQKLAEELGGEVYLLADVGEFVFLNTPLAKVCGLSEDGGGRMRERLHANIVMGDERTYDQDPRFGLMTMSQIASKALSPGINDPGTAIDIIDRQGRILSLYRDETQVDAAPTSPRLHVRPLDAEELIADAFDSLARDGAGLREVQERLQRVLAGLMRHPDPGLSRVAQERSAEYLERALATIDWEPDRKRLKAALRPSVRRAD